MEGGPPYFPQGSSCLVVLRILACLCPFRIRDCYPLRSARSSASFCYELRIISPVHYPAVYCYTTVWALPRSLATTYGISVDFFSCGYLDVSVPRVSPLYTMDSCTGTRALTSGGFPHSEIHGSTAICAFPWLIAACHVLHRLLVPRHSPYALNSLTCLQARLKISRSPGSHKVFRLYTSMSSYILRVTQYFCFSKRYFICLL